jgi:hypothetical protein
VTAEVAQRRQGREDAVAGPHAGRGPKAGFARMGTKADAETRTILQKLSIFLAAYYAMYYLVGTCAHGAAHVQKSFTLRGAPCTGQGELSTTAAGHPADLGGACATGIMLPTAGRELLNLHMDHPPLRTCSRAHVGSPPGAAERDHGGGLQGGLGRAGQVCMGWAGSSRSEK